MSEENKAIVRRAFEEVWNQGNLSVIDEILSPEYTGHAPPESVKSSEEFKELVMKYRAALPDIHFTIEEMEAVGDKVITRWTSSGTHNGDLMGITATGKRTTTTGITIMRIADGKCVEERSNWDALGFMQQLGVVTMPAQAKSQSAG